jgi:hypothetical protein
MPLLNRSQILQADDLKTEDVTTPEWLAGGAVRVRGLSASERVKIAQRSMNSAGQVESQQALDLLILIPVLCCVDDGGQPLFTEGDVEALGKKDGAPLQRIMEAALRLSQIDVEDLKKD